MSRKIAIRILSDVHLEGINQLPKTLYPFITPHYKYARYKNVIALLGDIGYPHENIYKTFINTLALNYDHVFVLNGNHEYYNYKTNNKYTIKDVDMMTQEVCSKKNNTTFLQNNSHKYENILFSGSTFWSQITTNYKHLEKYHSDYKYISINDIYNKDEVRQLQIKDTNYMNMMSRCYFNDILQKHKKEKHVIFTHYSPFFNSIITPTADPKYNNKLNTEAYHNNMHNFISYNSNIELWGFGHTHYTTKFKYQDTTFWANQICNINIPKANEEEIFIYE
jgi:predicted MPP superfamily phosphohydrolase